MIKVARISLIRTYSAAQAQQRNEKGAPGSKFHFSLERTGVLILE